MPDDKVTADHCVPPAEDLALLIEAVREAGAIAKRAYDANDSKVWDKDNNSPVTEADIAVNDYLDATLRAARPGYGWLSEETKDDHSRHACPRTFVVDPIDGTRAFIDRKPHFTVSVAIIEDGHSIAGVVFNPLKDELFAASKGGGATLNDAPIQVSQRRELEGATLVGYPRKFRRLEFPKMQVLIANSMAYRMVMVASGEADGTVSFTPKSDWDVAAATLILSEAGARVTDLRGDAPRFDGESTSGFGIICAGPALHDLLVARITPHLEKLATPQGRVQLRNTLGTRMSDREQDIQLLHLVFGGELIDPMKTQFKDLKAVDFIGAFPDYASARDAWRAAAQRTVDNAHMRYFVLHAHELIDPDKDGIIG